MWRCKTNNQETIRLSILLFHSWCNLETLSLIEEIAGTCFREQRTDNTDVIFKKISI